MADTLFALTPPAAVTAEPRRFGYDGVVVRHLVRDPTGTPAERFAPTGPHLAHSSPSRRRRRTGQSRVPARHQPGERRLRAARS